MRKVMHFDSPRENYRADAAVIWCFDTRFEPLLRKLLQRRGVVHADIIRVAGGAKSLATPEPEADRAFMLDQIRKSIRLHSTPRLILMVHSDCGAYGGLAQFRGDENAEAAHHHAELQRAAACLRQTFPELDVECYFVNFNGVWAVV